MTTREATAGALAVAAFLLTGCQEGTESTSARDVTSSETRDGPGTKTEDIAESDTFTYQLLTHCGIRWAQFKGKRWVTPFLSNAEGNGPPDGWDNPFQEGQVRLVSKNRAVFTSEGNKPLIFRATDKRWPQPGCA